MEFAHKSVLLQEVIDSLNVQPDGIYVDGTLGGAGHAYEVCRRLGPDGRMIGIDQDEDAIAAATKRLADFKDQVTIVRSNYEAMKDVLHDLGIERVNGITLDLGVSSYQLDAAERGFSYREDAPLDMRMDNRQEVTAATVVNEYTESELFQVIRKYGEDKFAKNIAKHIVQERQKEPVLTTGRLAEIVDQSIPMKFKKQGGHPAKRTFQAIRIEVNRELTVLEDHISEMIDLLAPGCWHSRATAAMRFLIKEAIFWMLTAISLLQVSRCIICFWIRQQSVKKRNISSPQRMLWKMYLEYQEATWIRFLKKILLPDIIR